MSLKLIIYPLVIVSLAGCGTPVLDLHYDGVKPIYPEATLLPILSIPRVDSLRPTFQWEESASNATYDFAIWDAVGAGEIYDIGKLVYLREGLRGTSHVPGMTLLPMKKYFWSVRLSGDDEWSTVYVKTLYLRRRDYIYDNCEFLFETPMTATKSSRH